AHALQERREIVRVLLFLRQDLLEQAPRGRIVLAEVVDHLAIAVDGDPLGDQVFLDHVLERVASTYSAWLREARPSGEKSGSPPSCVMRSAIWSACCCSSCACARNSEATLSAWMPFAE